MQAEVEQAEIGASVASLTALMAGRCCAREMLSTRDAAFAFVPDCFAKNRYRFVPLSMEDAIDARCARNEAVSRR